MMVKLTYLVKMDCLLIHTSIGRPSKHGSPGGFGQVLSHDEAKEYLGTPCDPGILPFVHYVDEKDVLKQIKLVNDLGWEVEVEYLPKN